jgi:hypothetical protein
VIFFLISFFREAIIPLLELCSLAVPLMFPTGPVEYIDAFLPDVCFFPHDAHGKARGARHVGAHLGRRNARGSTWVPARAKNIFLIFRFIYFRVETSNSSPSVQQTRALQGHQN